MTGPWLQNSGTCAWPEDTALVFVSGDELEVVEVPTLEPLPPQASLDVKMSLRAPAAYGSYTGVWQLQYGDGQRFGDDLKVACVVGPTLTPRPTPTPTASPTPEVSPTPVQPLWMSIPGLAWCDDSKTKGQVTWGYGGGPSDEYHFFYNRLSPDYELPGPYQDFTGFPKVDFYFTTSGPITWPVPENCCPGDNGRYVSPDGSYEIVWYHVWLPANQCPAQR